MADGMKNEYHREEFQMSLLPTGKFRHTCRTRDAFIKDTWSEQAQASEDLQKDGIRGEGLMNNDRISLARAREIHIRTLFPVRPMLHRESSSGGSPKKTPLHVSG